MVGAVALRHILSGVRALLSCIMCAGMVCALVSPAFSAGGQTGILSGTVTDMNKQIIPGAAISAASPTASYSATTGPNGTFTIVGVNVDTYVVSVSAAGYDTYVLRGATVTGDQMLILPLTLSKAAAVIGRVGARSASGAFQPAQTIDSYTISGARMQQTTGSPANQNLNDLVLSAPGVTLAANGSPTIRGGALREVSYQFDGVPFDEPFLGQNGAAGLFNGLNSLQVVEGAGDASQGSLGSGVINAIPKRGTYPNFGAVTVQVGGPNYNNAAIGEFGFATPDGRISNYIGMAWNRYAPYFGFHAQDAASYGNYFQESLRNNSQFVDNFVFKFGANNNQSLQVLYENVSQLRYGNLGGIPAGTFPANPFALPYYPFDSLTQPGAISLVAPAPYTPNSNVPVSGPELQLSTQTRFLKLEYDNSINASTYLALRYYNWERLDYQQTLYSLGPAQNGLADYAINGGPVVGGSFDLTHSFSDKLTMTLNGQYSNIHPIDDVSFPLITVFGPLIGDFAPPAAGCPVAGQGLGYVSCAYGTGTVLAPGYGNSSNGSFFQNYGLGLRIQYSPTTKLHFDFGARYEGQNQHWFSPIGNPNDINNPFDVPTQLWTPQIVSPKQWEPRFSVNYQLSTSDAVRASYGRTVVFISAQNAGTPLGLKGNLAPLAALPPNTVGLTPGQIATQCGTSPTNPVIPLPNTKPFPCQNYLQQYFWSIDNGLDAPDGGGILPASYSDYDFSYSHQFKNGLAFKVTPFYKFGTNLPTSVVLLTLPGGGSIFSGGSKGVNRTTGVEFSLTTADRPVGFSGFLSGTYQNVLQSAPPFSSGEFAGSPQLSFATTALGDVYRAGYVAPASVRIGGTYTFKNGFSITPIIQIDSGFPYNVGDTIASGSPTSAVCPVVANYPQVNFGCGVIPSGILGYQNMQGTYLNTNYYDPAYSGSQANPNIAATRGTPSSSQSGGVTWYPNVRLDLTLQYKHGRDSLGVEFRNLFDNGYNGSTPSINPFYQPVANGVSGPQTGQNVCTGGVPNLGIPAFGSARGCAAIPANAYAFANGAYILTNNAIGTTSFVLAPLAQTQINFFYRRQF
jgi:hypothetical protein